MASAGAFAREGARVVISGRSEKTLHSAVEHIGSGTVGVRADIWDLQQIQALMDKIRECFGRLDVLFVNSGIGAFLAIERVTERDWDDSLKVAATALFLASDEASFITGIDMLVDGGAGSS